jgi:polysaccharide pyruvyl transferase WcaK-like protein
LPLRILADNGEYSFQNKGDLAMLAVTVERLLERWPDARVGVITFEPRMLRAYMPRAEPIALSHGGGWQRADWFDHVAKRLGPALISPAVGLRSRAVGLVRNPPRFVRRSVPAVERPGGEDDAQPDPWEHPVPTAIDESDLVIAVGGGYIADVDRVKAHWTLNLLEQAADRAIPTAMLGQGLGPIEDPQLTARARAVLPRVDVIALRELRVGPSLLERWGVSGDRVMVTGDDAIELAYRAAGSGTETDLGVCLRSTSYAPVAHVARRGLREAIHASAHELGARLAPLIISEYQSEDRRATLPLVSGFPEVMAPLGLHASAKAVVKRVAACRVVITGAYHLAVFALSQGTPVVALTASRYSEDKMCGLARQFGTGVTVLDLNDADLERRAREAITSSWREAPSIREALLKASTRQIHASRKAFERVFRLVESRHAN